MVFQPIGADNVTGALPPKVLTHLQTLFSDASGDTYDDTAIRSLITDGDEEVLRDSKLYADQKVATIPAGPQGPKGDTGSIGPQGIQGPIGLTGPAAATTIDQKPVTDLPSTYPTGISIMPVASGTGWPASFATVETVRFGTNRSFQTIVERTTGKSWRRTPDANDTGWLPWIEWGAQGPQGIQGPKGDQGIQGIAGAAASITSATATTGLPGSAVSVALGGTSNARTFEFTIPRGEQGAQGLKGDKGDQGAQGIQGTTGTSASITGVTVSTGNAGTAASVSMGGTSTARTFAFTIPRGDQGLQGLKGDKGDPGVPGADGTGIQITGSVSTMSQLPTTGNTTGDAYIANDTGLLHVWGGSSWGAGVQFRGPEGPQGLQGIQGVKGDTGNQGIQGVKGDKGDAGTPGIQGIQGAKGDKGDTGDAGTPATITAVSASTGVAGSAASVSMGGTASARTFAFTIPRGDTGLTGADGPKGDKGDKGDQGIPGIQGQQGIQGLQGVAGTAAAITGATAITGLPGSNASVTLGGSSSSRTFEFTIPRGDKGDKGDPGDGANVDLTPYAKKSNLPVNVKDYGATGNGVTDDYAAIISALTASTSVVFPEGNYRVATQIKRSFSGYNLVGYGKARIFSDTVVQPFRFNATDGAYIEGLTFETTATSGVDNSYGVVCSLGVSMKNITFVNCEFRAPNAGTNGLKIVADGLTTEFAVDNIQTINCRFINCGRMGFEVQDHTAPGTVLIRDVGATNCEFVDCGNISTGISLSFSGKILAPSARGNKFRRAVTIGLEFAGAPDTPIATDNEFYDMGENCSILSITNNQEVGDVQYAVIERNRSIGRSGKDVRIRRLIDGKMSDNVFRTRQGVTLLDCVRLTSVGDIYDTDGGPYALYVESGGTRASKQNKWTNVRLMTGTSAFATARFYGATCTDNQVINSFSSASVGSHIDQLNGATRNQFIEVGIGSNVWNGTKYLAMTDVDRTVSLVSSDANLILFTGTTQTAPRKATFSAQYRSWKVINNSNMGVILGAGGNTVTLESGQSGVFSLEDQVATLVTGSYVTSSPNGTKYRLSVTDDGSLTTTTI